MDQTATSGPQSPAGTADDTLRLDVAALIVGALNLEVKPQAIAPDEPLCTRFARMVRGALDARVVHYTRQVTLAWTIFFAAMMTISIALYLLAPISVWSTFANLLSLPLVALMFVIEYAIRIRVFPDLPHKPILESLRAYRNSLPASTTPPR